MPIVDNPGSGGGMAAGDVNLLSQGRLTLLSGDPAPSADQVGKSVVYFTPYKGNTIALLDSGGSWELLAFSQISITLSGLTSGKNYDVFAYDNGGTLTLELSAAWTNDTTRADALALVDGVRVKSANHTRRFLGTFRTTSTTTTEDSLTKRLLINYYNRVVARMFSCPGYVDVDSSTTYAAAVVVYTKANGGTGSTLEFLSNGEDEIDVESVCGGFIPTSGGSTALFVGFGVDGVTDVPVATLAQGLTATGFVTAVSPAKKGIQPAEGRHTVDLVFNTNGDTAVIVASESFNGAAHSPATTYIGAILQR